MHQARIDELSHQIHDVCERLDELDKAIDRCGASKRRTRWFADRIRAREELLAIRKRLYREQLALLLAQDDAEDPTGDIAESFTAIE
jgi:septal ring factor EnvC (AmiA/AmiB activator)